MRLVPPKYWMARIQYKSAATDAYSSVIRRAVAGEVTYSVLSSIVLEGYRRSRTRCIWMAAAISSPIVTTAAASRAFPVIYLKSRREKITMAATSSAPVYANP